MKKKIWNPQQRTSFGYRLLACIDTDSGQNNMVTRWILDGGDDGGHRYGRDNADAKENYYGEDNDDKGRPQKKNYVIIWEIFPTLLSKNSPHITLKSPIKTNQFFSEGVPNADYDVENDDVTNVKLQATAPTRLKGWDKVVNIHIILLYYDKLHQISKAQFFD